MQVSGALMCRFCIARQLDTTRQACWHTTYTFARKCCLGFSIFILLLRQIISAMNRKDFLLNTVVGGSAITLAPFKSFAKFAADPVPYSADIVKEFVIAGHGNLPRVKEMLEQYPNLVFARHDWGNGDFEEAIEGAGHVGNKEIARFLIAQGARANMYVLTMLGETATVKSLLEKYPSQLNGKGPHGFTLLHHAIKGGEEAMELLEYIKAKGLTEMQYKIK